MRRLVLALAVAGTILIFAPSVYGQAAAEAAMGAAASSMGSSPAGSIGKSVGGILSNLEKTLKSGESAVSTTLAAPATSRPAAKTSQPARRAAPAPAVPVAPPEPPPSYEDAAEIDKGIEYADLLRRFGPPAMQFSNGSDAQTMTYISAGGTVQVELQSGRVTSVAKPKSKA